LPIFELVVQRRLDLELGRLRGTSGRHDGIREEREGTTRVDRAESTRHGRFDQNNGVNKVTW
jgi:hypothetical protein